MAGRERKNAIVTGGASGLGRALCLKLAKEGYNIAVCDVNDAGAQETVELIRKAGGDGRAEHLDVTSIEEWEKLSSRLRSEWKHLDLLVNNAGVAGAGEVGQYSIRDWHWIMNVNLWNGIYGCHTFVDWLKANPNGAHIINTASMAAIGSAPTMAAYNVTKAGMLALSETLYGELEPHKVGVTVLCPAFFPTNLLKESRFASPEQKSLAETMFKIARMTADDVAEAAMVAMRRKELYVIVPFEARIQWWYKRLTPKRFLRTVAAQFSKRFLQPAAARS